MKAWIYDALVPRLRIALVTDPGVTEVSLDGFSAYDTVSRVVFLAKLRQVTANHGGFMGGFGSSWDVLQFILSRPLGF